MFYHMNMITYIVSVVYNLYTTCRIKIKRTDTFVSIQLRDFGDEYGIRTRECMRERHVS